MIIPKNENIPSPTRKSDEKNGKEYSPALTSNPFFIYSLINVHSFKSNSPDKINRYDINEIIDIYIQ